MNAARSTLEEIKDTTLSGVANIQTAGFIPADLPNGAITITTNPANVSAVTIATVTVTVTWTGPRNRPMTLEITTMRSAF